MSSSISSMAPAGYYMAMTHSMGLWRARHGLADEETELFLDGDSSALEPWIVQRSGQDGVVDYYVGGLEPDGVWFNPGGFLGLEDSSAVVPKDFRKLCRGFAPNGEKLTRNAGSDKRVTGLDITFSADKTISSLWALCDDKTREIIEEAQQKAVCSALDYLRENASLCRRGIRGKVLERCEFIAATFRHSTSRALDPQLHTHATIMNVSFRQDQTTGSLDQPAFYRHTRTAGALYRNVLAREMREELGLEMERHGVDQAFTRIRDFPEELVMLWSKRRQDIVSESKKLDLNPSKSGRMTSLFAVLTRPGKQADETPAAMFERFRREGMELGYSQGLIEEMVASYEAFDHDALEAELMALPETLLETDALFEEKELMNRFWNTLGGRLSPDQESAVLERIKAENHLVYLGLNHKNERIYTTPEMLLDEVAVGAITAELRASSEHRIPEAVAREKLTALKEEGVLLSREQREAFVYTTAGSGAVSIIEGAAGSGKSTILSAITALYQEQGFDVIGTSTLWRIAGELAEDCGIEAYAVEKLLYEIREGGIAFGENSVLIVDEAGTISTGKGLEILRAIRESGAKVVLVGDREQQQAIQPGSVLRLAQAVEQGVRIDHIRRQKADIEDVLVYLSRKEGEVIDRETARLQAGYLSKEDREALVERHRGTVERYGVVWQREAAKAFKEGQAEEGLRAYDERSCLRFCETKSAAIVALCSDVIAYEASAPDKLWMIQARTNEDVGVITESYRSLRKEQGDLSGEEIELVVPGTKPGQKHTLKLAVGDRFRFGKKHEAFGVVNGTAGVITAMEQKGDSVVLSALVEGREIVFAPEDFADNDGLVRLKSGYVTTIYSAQGQTVDASFSLVDPELKRESAYALATRHRDRAVFYFARDLATELVRSTRHEENRMAPVTRDEMITEIGKRWAVSYQKELVHDYADQTLIERYELYHARLERGEEIGEQLGADSLALEARRMQQLEGQLYKGEDLERRIFVGQFGALRRQAAELGEAIRADLKDGESFFAHRDAPAYHRLRVRADSHAAVIALEYDSYVPALTIYPNIKKKQLDAALGRHQARSLVGEWQEAIKGGALATADRLAHDILEQHFREKAGKGKTTIATALRETELSDVWSRLYEGRETFLETRKREGLSAGEIAERDLLLDYRRQSRSVGRLYSRLAASGQEIRNLPGSTKLRDAMARRDHLAAELLALEPERIKAFGLDRGKLEGQARLGEARQLVTAWSLQESIGAREKRDAIAAEILTRVREEKELSSSGDRPRPSEQPERLDRSGLEGQSGVRSAPGVRVMARAVMERGLDWQALFASKKDHEERAFLDGKDPEEIDRHRAVQAYVLAGRQVGQLYGAAREEAAQESLELEQTGAWQQMVVSLKERDRLAFDLMALDHTDPSFNYFRVKRERLEQQADAYRSYKLVEDYKVAAAAGEEKQAGRIAQELLALVYVEKTEERPRAALREIRTAGLDWRELYDARKAWQQEKDQALDTLQPEQPGTSGATIQAEPLHIRQTPKINPKELIETVSAELKDRSLELCLSYLSAGSQRGDKWFVGSINNERGDSFVVDLIKGTWYENAKGMDRNYGDMLDLVQILENCPTPFEAAKLAKEKILGQPIEERAILDRRQKQGDEEERARKIAKSVRLFEGAKSIEGTPAETYLRARGIEAVESEDFRFANTPYWENRQKKILPTFLQAIRDEYGEIVSVNRIFLNSDGSGKADVTAPKKVTVNFAGYGVHLGARDREDLIVGEGVETVSSLSCALPEFSALAGLSGYHTSVLKIPEGVKRVYLACDNDAAGKDLEGKFRARSEEEGFELIVLKARGNDFNDDHRDHGLEAVKQNVLGQISAAGVEVGVVLKGEQAFAEIQDKIDFYFEASERLEGMQAEILREADYNEITPKEVEGYDKWFQWRQKLELFGQELVGLKDEIVKNVPDQGRKLFELIDFDNRKLARTREQDASFEQYREFEFRKEQAAPLIEALDEILQKHDLAVQAAPLGFSFETSNLALQVKECVKELVQKGLEDQIGSNDPLIREALEEVREGISKEKSQEISRGKEWEW